MRALYPRGGQGCKEKVTGVWRDDDGPVPSPLWHDPAVEFLNFVLIFAAGYLVLRHPGRERLAFRLLVASSVLMAALFLIGARGSVLPGLNY